MLAIPQRRFVIGITYFAVHKRARKNRLKSPLQNQIAAIEFNHGYRDSECSLNECRLICFETENTDGWFFQDNAKTGHINDIAKELVGKFYGVFGNFIGLRIANQRACEQIAHSFWSKFSYGRR